MRNLRTAASAFLLAATLVAGGTASAEMIDTSVNLEGEQEVPPVETSAMGSAEVEFDTETRMLSWTLEYSDLSSEATAAHFHGPAEPGKNAPPVVTIEDYESGAKGSAELTEEQAAALMDGMMYINVHTQNHADGEIRGQVTIAE